MYLQRAAFGQGQHSVYKLRTSIVAVLAYQGYYTSVAIHFFYHVSFISNKGELAQDPITSFFLDAVLRIYNSDNKGSVSSF